MITDKDHLGRAEQKLPLLTAQQSVALQVGGTITGVLLAWHTALVITAGIPVAGIGVTLRGLIAVAPLSLGAKYHANPAAAAAMFGVFLAVGVVAVVAARRWWNNRTGRHPLGLATGTQARMSAGEMRARKVAAWTRRGSVAAGRLNVDRAPLAEVGFLLGYKQDDGEPIVLSLEDQTGIIAPTGAGKTLYLMVNACLDAPGPLVATSTKPEILDAIVEARTGKGRVWVFDPLNIAHWPEPMVWDPTAGCQDPAAATSRGLAFAGGLLVDDGKDGSFFQVQAGIIMARLLRAAAVDGHGMDTVISWGTDLASAAQRAVLILGRDPGTAAWGATLTTATTGADETVSSVRMTMAQKVEPMLNPVVMRQLVPTQGVSVFDPATFVTSTDTLVLITDDQAQTNVAPLTTMLLNDVMDAAKKWAALSPTGALDPPLRVAGDEIANVAPLPKLPGMLSDSRGIGVQWFPAFQSVAQILARWGEKEGRMILANLNCSLVLGGLQDEKALDRFSALVGQVDMVQVASNVDAGNIATGRQVAMTERTVLRQEEIRHLPDGTALVIYRNAPAMLVNMVAWRDRPDGADIMAGMQRVRAARVAHHQAGR